MPRFARLLTIAAVLLPSSAAAQAAAPPDPWLISFVGLSGRTARANLTQLDRALTPYGASYTRLPVEERARMRQAFDDLLPGQRITRHTVTEPQARAIAYLALGPWERRGVRDCDGPRRRGVRTRCDQAIDSLSRQAAWIHSTALALGRTGNRRPRAKELGDLRAMNQHARGMVLGSSDCGCPAAREDAEVLLVSTRDALDAYEASSMPAWMSLGDQRVRRIAGVSDSLERTFLRCVGPA